MTCGPWTATRPRAPDALMLFCGMSIGFEDVTVASTGTGHAPLDETVTFVQS